MSEEIKETKVEKAEEIKKEKKVAFASVSPAQIVQDDFNEQIIKNSGGQVILADLIKNAMGTTNKKRVIPRLAFSENPLQYDHYAGIYKIRKDLCPASVIKKIRVQNLHVAAILRGRGNLGSMMGHIRKDRFDIGTEITVKKEFKDFIEPEQMNQIQDRINIFTKKLLDCGNSKGLKEKDKLSLSEFLDIQIRNGLSFGWFFTEIVRKEDGSFDRFRPVDAGTFHPAVKKGELADTIRAQSIQFLQALTGDKTTPKISIDKEYSWVQVIDGIPRQAFADEEMLCYNLYPSSDIEHNGFPVTPIDTVLTSITTSLSIEMYNRLYFQNGRAAKGMIVIRSDEIDQSTLESIKQEMVASINDVTNSFRTPLFGVGKEDEVVWMPMVTTQKDGEFQFLYDQVTRNILAAFNMSPEELPSYGYLGRGTNQQSLSESSNEWKLTASRDSGLRPLVLKIQDFFNEKLFPIIDPELAQLCVINLAGLDAQTKEQESARLQQDMPIHLDYDTLMQEVEKQPIGEYLGGKIPFNERIRAIFDSYVNNNKVIGELTNSPAALIDPLLKYKRDQFFMQHLNNIAQFNPEAAMAYFATRKDSHKLLKILLQDYLDEDAESYKK